MPVVSPPDYQSPELNYSELNSLFNICGYIISSIKKTTNICKDCLDSVGSYSRNTSKYAKLSHIKCFKKDSLFFCNDLSFEYFCELEKIFSVYWTHIKDQSVALKSFYIRKMQCIAAPHIVSCHNLVKHIISRFVGFRLKIAGRKKIQGLAKQKSSKSVAMHSI